MHRRQYVIRVLLITLLSVSKVSVWLHSHIFLEMSSLMLCIIISMNWKNVEWVKVHSHTANELQFWCIDTISEHHHILSYHYCPLFLKKWLDWLLLELENRVHDVWMTWALTKQDGPRKCCRVALWDRGIPDFWWLTHNWDKNKIPSVSASSVFFVVVFNLSFPCLTLHSAGETFTIILMF